MGSAMSRGEDETQRGGHTLPAGPRGVRVMPTYLVRARPRPGKLVKLRRKLELGDIALMRGFGKSLESGLKDAKRSAEGDVLWEQKSESKPPLSHERRAILDEFFRDVEAVSVAEGEGWERIKDLRPFWEERDVTT